MVGRNPNADVTLSPQDAEAILAGWLGRRATCLGVTRLHGGMCYGVVRLRFDCAPFSVVAKLDVAPDGPGLSRERDNLRCVRSLTRFPAPRPYLEDSTRTRFPFAFLLLEDLPGTSLESARLSRQERARVDLELAEVLLDLHSNTRSGFGEVGSGAQHSRWADVLVPKLFDLRRDMEGQLPAEALRGIDTALAGAKRLFADSGLPTLVHGDLWGGNILVVAEPDGWRLSGVVDWPALQYADVEYELAYLEAWSTVTPTFFEYYSRRAPLREGYELRRLFYWLHTYMLHVWLFEEDRYRRLVTQTADRIVKAFAG